MKIISKYRDYYDYLQGIYGIDEKLILDRRSGKTKYNLTKKTILVICGKVIEFYVKEGKFYISNQLEKINNKKHIYYKNAKYIITDSFSNNYPIYYPELSEDIYNKYPGLQEFSKKSPIFFLKKNINDNLEIIEEFPQLSIIGIQKIIKPEEIWLMLSQWLSERITEKEPNVPIGNDKIQILNAGFNLKTSFRNIK